MNKIKPAFQAELQQQPDKIIRLIVHIKGNLPDATAQLMQRGVTVLRSFDLINAIAVSCPAATALALLHEPWVQAIEEDRQVFTQQ